MFNNKENLLSFLKSNFYQSKFANSYMSYEKLSILFHINTLKLFSMQRYITDVECISDFCKITSASWSLRRRWNNSFVNIILEVFRTCFPQYYVVQKR